MNKANELLRSIVTQANELTLYYDKLDDFVGELRSIDNALDNLTQDVKEEVG